MIIPIYGVLWRVNRFFILLKMRLRHNRTYQIRIFHPGCGLHFKFILTDRQSGYHFLVKTTSWLVEWWQNVVFRWKAEAGLNIEYPGRSFEKVVSIIKEYCSVPELYRRSYINQVDIHNREIWYNYHPNSRIANERSPKDARLVNALWNLLKKNDFYYVDQSFDNILIEDGNAFLVDLESLIKLQPQKTDRNTSNEARD